MVDRHHPGKAPTALLQVLSNGACLTIQALEQELDLTRRQISDAASCLLRRDYLMRMDVGCYQLTEAGLSAAQAGEIITSGPKGPHFGIRRVKNTLRERAWRSMRVQKRFTIPDIVSSAAIETDGNPHESVARYLRALRDAGYVKASARRVDKVSETSNGFKVWMLIRDTGRLAPVVLSKIPAIRDLNLGEDVPCKRA